MKCEHCGKDEAVIRLTRIEGDDVNSTLLCQACAAEKSPYQKQMLQKQGLDYVLKELVKHHQKGAVVEALVEAHVLPDVDPCPNCGLEWISYRSTYMLGCPECYEAFAEHLESDLIKMHRATHHVGSGPTGANEALVQQQRRLEQARDELKQAIAFEDFSHAAYLRDQIKTLEAQLEIAKEEEAAT